MRRRFFVERFEGEAALLRGEAAEHLGRVLRAEKGQLYELSDGTEVWLGRIECVAVKKGEGSSVEFALIERIRAVESKLQVHVLISIVKFDRFEWCLEKATELGANEITPLAAARSDKPLLAAAAKRAKRWEKILMESAQQARRLRPPAMAAVMRPGEAFKQTQASTKVLLSERPDATPIRDVLDASRIGDVALAFGPEGGWTDEELAGARGHGFAEASLGENILRAETAVIAAVAIVRFARGDSNGR